MLEDNNGIRSNVFNTQTIDQETLKNSGFFCHFFPYRKVSLLQTIWSQLPFLSQLSLAKTCKAFYLTWKMTSSNALIPVHKCFSNNASNITLPILPNVDSLNYNSSKKQIAILQRESISIHNIQLKCLNNLQGLKFPKDIIFTNEGFAYLEEGSAIFFNQEDESEFNMFERAKCIHYVASNKTIYIGTKGVILTKDEERLNKDHGPTKRARKEPIRLPVQEIPTRMLSDKQGDNLFIVTDQHSLIVCELTVLNKCSLIGKVFNGKHAIILDEEKGWLLGTAAPKLASDTTTTFIVWDLKKKCITKELSLEKNALQFQNSGFHYNKEKACLVFSAEEEHDDNVSLWIWEPETGALNRLSMQKPESHFSLKFSKIEFDSLNNILLARSEHELFAWDLFLGKLIRQSPIAAQHFVWDRDSCSLLTYTSNQGQGILTLRFSN